MKKAQATQTKQKTVSKFDADFSINRTNTEFERLALTAEINLSDGHARADLTPAQLQIVERTPSIFSQASRVRQDEAERQFALAFFQCARQTSALELSMHFSYSASIATIVAARVLKKLSADVFLIEPCFDNIVHLLSAEGLAPRPIPEEALNSNDLACSLAEIPIGASLWIVAPNNPTGNILTRDRFEALLLLAKEMQWTLVFDFCFRFYAGQMYAWDQYQSLSDAGVRFLSIEDTGKTWPVLDIKCSTLVSCDEFSDTCRRLNEEILLGVSPWQLLILKEFINDANGPNAPLAIRRATDDNRKIARRLLQSPKLRIASAFTENTPFELFELLNGLSSRRLWGELCSFGVHILPAQNYFWSSTNGESGVFRIPLSRPQKELETAVDSILVVLEQL